MARPKIDIDQKLVRNLALIQCTQAEIGQIVGVSVDTLLRRKWFRVLYKKALDEGHSSLRRLQWKVANGDYLAKRVTRITKQGDEVTEETFANPNPTMLIWLGKQYLGQADKTEIEGTVRLNKDASELSDEELQNIARGGSRRNGGRGRRRTNTEEGSQEKPAVIL